MFILKNSCYILSIIGTVHNLNTTFVVSDLAIYIEIDSFGVHYNNLWSQKSKQIMVVKVTVLLSMM